MVFDTRRAPATAPSWVADAVVYQIFPDRFRRSGRVEAQRQLALMPWGSDPAAQGFQGGDLFGVIEALDHLQELGISCLSLNPVFSSAANHRYHAYDYLQVDPLLGGNAALEALITAVHARGMRLILDGVFNHCGRGFWAFHHLLENGERSPYRDWFYIDQWPLQPYPRQGENCGYHCWWNDPALPKFRHDHPPVREYLLGVARHWIAAGIDGWRLDVPDELPPDFWNAFRQEVRRLNPDAWIVGEIWGDATTWLGGDRFDGVMNYPLTWSLLGYFGARTVRRELKLAPLPKPPYQPLDRAGFQQRLEQELARYPQAVIRSQLNLLDSHDTPRALHALGGDQEALRLALLMLFLLPGAPCLYYGTEMGLGGGPEPACREAFPWDEAPGPLFTWLQELTGLRRQLPALRSTALTVPASPSDDLLLLTRGEGSARLWVAINRSDAALPLPLPLPAGPMELLWSCSSQPGWQPLAAGSWLPGRGALILAAPPG
jgi:cyclomaltodextrinase / maltogenic alpha-amylase / neopullulanase